MSETRVRRLVRRSRATTVVQLVSLTLVLFLAIWWWAGRQDGLTTVAALAVAVTIVVFGAMRQLADLRQFAGRVRARANRWSRLETGDIVVPEPERPADATLIIVEGVASRLGLARGSVVPVVQVLESNPDARDLPMASVLPPSRGTSIVLIDNDLDARVREAVDGDRPYGSDPDDFLSEVHAVLAHELAHVQVWDTAARPIAHGLEQVTPRFAWTSAVLVAASSSLTLAWIGGVALLILAASVASGRGVRGLTLMRIAASAWALAATILEAISWPQLGALAVASVVPPLVSAAFERRNEFYADRIAVAITGDARALARFLRRFPDYEPGVRALAATHPSTKRRLGRLARMH